MEYTIIKISCQSKPSRIMVSPQEIGERARIFHLLKPNRKNLYRVKCGLVSLDKMQATFAKLE